MVGGVVKELEDRAIGAQTVTFDGLAGMLDARPNAALASHGSTRR